VHMKTSQKPPSSVKKAPKKSVKPASGRYYIQVGMFSKVPDKKYFKKIKDVGFTYTIRRGKKVRVLVGRYKDKRSAKSALSKARKKIMPDAFVVKL